MRRRVSSPSPEAKDTLRALRRAAKNALELGLKTGTPVYVYSNNKIVDLTKEQRTAKKTRSSARHVRHETLADVVIDLYVDNISESQTSLMAMIAAV